MKTPTEVQADIIRELEAKVSLLLDDLFYAKAEIVKLRMIVQDKHEN
jgi:hypothetical protein